MHFTNVIRAIDGVVVEKLNTGLVSNLREREIGPFAVESFHEAEPNDSKDHIEEHDATASPLHSKGLQPLSTALHPAIISDRAFALVAKLMREGTNKGLTEYASNLP